MRVATAHYYEPDEWVHERLVQTSDEDATILWVTSLVDWAPRLIATLPDRTATSGASIFAQINSPRGRLARPTLRASHAAPYLVGSIQQTSAI